MATGCGAVDSHLRYLLKVAQSELYGICSQMKRAAVSIPSNIAEGIDVTTRKNLNNF